MLFIMSFVRLLCLCGKKMFGSKLRFLEPAQYGIIWYNSKKLIKELKEQLAKSQI
jgi:hypothetical protein